MDKKIILVSGYPAAGKSTFARKLAQSLSVPCFTKDTIKESMADGFGVESTEILKKGSAATFNTMLHIAECFLQVGNLCILESNFMMPEGERVRALLKKYNANCLTYVFSGDFDILYDRYAHRKEAGERHWVHKDPGERDSFKDALLKYKIGQLEIGTVIPVDGTDFDKIDYDELIAIAKRFIHDTDSKKGYIEKLRSIIGNMRIMLPGCCVFIRNKAGQILMQQRTYPYGKWGLPGGLMELGESPQDTVRREILEETGLKLGELTLFGVYSGENYLCIAQNGDEFQVVTSVFVTEDYSGEIAIMDDESLAFEWFDINKLPQNIAKTHMEIIGDYIRQRGLGT